MAKLPEPDWVKLSESAERAAQAFGAELSAVETALVEAFHEGKIRTRGRCRSYFADEYLQDLAGYTWDRVGVVWQANKFHILYYGAPLHIFSDVVVCREDLAKWINGAVSDSQRATHEPVENLTPEPPDKVAKPPGRGGRKPGSGAYTAQDHPLWKKMKTALDGGEATTVWGAAGPFAEDAHGAGHTDNKRRRLVAGYKRWIVTQ